MAVVFDAASGPFTNASATSITFSHTVGAGGTNRALVVVVSHGASTVSSVTYPGTTMTQVGTITNGAAIADIWAGVNPNTGANNVVVTMAAATSIATGATSFTGVNQTTPTGTFASATGATATPSVTVTSATGDRAVSGVCTTGDTTLTPNAPQTNRWNTGPFDGIMAGQGDDAGAASVTLAWTANIAVTWAIGGVSVKQAAAATATYGVATPDPGQHVLLLSRVP